MPFAEFNGIRMHYHEEGEGEPILLITGFGGDINFFHSLVPELRDRYRVITFESRGSGLTEYDGDFECQDLVDDVSGLLDHLGIYKAHILGWSLGSQIAMEFTLQHQDRVQTLTLVSAFERCPARSSYMMNTIIDAGMKGAEVEYVFAMVNAFSFTEDYFDAKRTKGQKVKAINSTTPAKLKQQMHCLDSYDLEGRLGAIKIPVLSIHGLEDIMVEPKKGDSIASAIPGCRLLRIPDVGHVIHPSLYAKEFKGFLLAHPKQ